MATPRSVLVTGVSGNLGTRLLPFLLECRVVGVDMRPPHDSTSLAHFQQMDLGREASCLELIDLLRSSEIQSVIHLAFVLDPQQTGVLDVERMWQINVAGTARVMEAISVVNRTGGNIRQFIFPSSVAAYGPETNGPVKEDAPLRAHTLPYAIHKRESDEVVRYRAESLGDCRIYILRPPHLHRRYRAELHGGRLARNPAGQEQTCRSHARRRQATAAHAAARPQISGEALPVRARRRHGAVADATCSIARTATRR